MNKYTSFNDGNLIIIKILIKNAKIIKAEVQILGWLCTNIRCCSLCGENLMCFYFVIGMHFGLLARDLAVNHLPTAYYFISTSNLSFIALFFVIIVGSLIAGLSL